MIRITLASVHVNDQARAEDFYTRVLGLVVVVDEPLGDHRWLTVASPAEPDGAQLLLEPDEHPAGDELHDPRRWTTGSPPRHWRWTTSKPSIGG